MLQLGRSGIDHAERDIGSDEYVTMIARTDARIDIVG